MRAAARVVAKASLVFCAILVTLVVVALWQRTYQGYEKLGVVHPVMTKTDQELSALEEQVQASGTVSERLTLNAARSQELANELAFEGLYFNGVGLAIALGVAIVSTWVAVAAIVLS